MRYLLQNASIVWTMLLKHPGKTFRSLKGLKYYLQDLKTLQEQQRTSAHTFAFGAPYPCLDDRFAESGAARGHYFHQDLLVARRIFRNNPQVHVDVGSRVDGFIAHVAAFRPIVMFDIRPLSRDIPNIRFQQADLMASLDAKLASYCDSLSCLHALEHFGLGRYGDPVYYDGYLVGLANLRRILKAGGKFYCSVPIGPQRIEFNAHRVFSVRFLLECFSGSFRIDDFSFVDDAGDLHESVPMTETGIQNNFGCRYGCGIFEMTKLQAETCPGGNKHD